MRIDTARRETGFTILELLTVVAVIAILGAIAVVGYQKYTARARGADIVLKYDAIRTSVGIRSQQTKPDDCLDLVRGLDSTNLTNAYATVAYGFEAVTGGYRPVLTVCSRADINGPIGVKTARGAYDTMANQSQVEKNPVLTDSLVSFALRLTPDEKPLCKKYTNPTTVACAPQPTATAVAAVKLLPAASAATAVPEPIVPPPALPKVVASVVAFSGPSAFARPAGMVLNTGGPLSAFTLDMTFIGSGSVPASSGGSGPVMFNYGTSADGHNAISLWNPRSLTVALANKNYDTGINVIDGLTHRLSTSWDSATGRLAVYDNGLLVKTFENVNKGQTLAGGGSLVVAHKDNGGGSYAPGEAFAGQVFRVSMANKALTAAELVKPVNQVMAGQAALLIDISAQNGKIVDVTGRHQIETGGASVVQAGVEGNLVNP